MHFETSFLENFVIRFAMRLTSSLLLMPPFGPSKMLKHFNNDNGSIRGCNKNFNNQKLRFSPYKLEHSFLVRFRGWMKD